MSADNYIALKIDKTEGVLQQHVLMWSRLLKEAPAVKLPKASVVAALNGDDQGKAHVSKLDAIPEEATVWLADAELLYSASGEDVGITVTLRY